MRRTKAKSFVFVAAAAFPVLLAGTARADETIKMPGDHPDYAVEVEPHGLIGWWGGPGYAGDGYGIGGRFSIPIVKNGFIKNINNSVAISFGADILFYNYCWYAGQGSCSATYLNFPVAMQWNFFVARHWSVFGEPGLYVWHGFINDCNLPNGNGCPNNPPAATGVYPAFWVGARYHFSDNVSLTMRLGWPTSSVGVSFFL
jgi:hypothetical protein